MGVILAAVGAVFLLRVFGLFPPIFYSIHFGWPLILVIVGLVIGFRSNFRRPASWILIIIGGANMMLPFYPYIGDVPTRQVFWPSLLILVGIAMILRKRDDRWDRRWHHKRPTQLLTSDADTLNIDATFGARKEVVTSRNFKGGIIRATFSGVEVNLATAEAGVQPMILEVYSSFAGVEIIIPSHWEIQNEIQPTLGNVEDARTIRTSDTTSEKRTLILRGSCNFGSVEIKSY